MEQKRYCFIDSLRVIAILMMFVFHVNMIFVAEKSWHIKDASSSNVLMEINYWMAFFRMPLLFVVSGFVSVILLQKMSQQNFIIQRFKRLIIPTFIGVFLWVAPQLFFENKLKGSEMNYIEFYASFLKFDWYPKGNFHWLHLWFIPYLFCYNLISIPFNLWISKTGIKAVLNKWFTNENALWVFIFMAVLPYTFLSVHYPTTHDLIHDYARHCFFIFFVFFGVILYQYPVLLEHIEKRRRLYFRAAFLIDIDNKCNTMERI